MKKPKNAEIFNQICDAVEKLCIWKLFLIFYVTSFDYEYILTFFFVKKYENRHMSWEQRLSESSLIVGPEISLILTKIVLHPD